MAYKFNSGGGGATNSTSWNSLTALTTARYNRIVQYGKVIAVSDSPFFPKRVSEYAQQINDFALQKMHEQRDATLRKLEALQSEKDSGVKYDAAFGGKYAQALSSIPGGRKVSDPKSSASGSSNNSRVDKAPPAQPAAPNDPALSSTSNRKGKQIALDDNYGRSSDFEEALDELNSLKMSDLPDDSGPNSAEPTINPPAQNPFGRPAIAKIWGEDAVIEKSIWEPGAEYDDDVSPWPQRDERKWYGEKRAELGWQRFLPRPRSYEVEQNEIAWLINQGIKPSAAMRFYTESKENIPWELRKLKADHRLTEAEEQRMLDDYSRWQQRVKAETAEAQAGRKKRGYRKEGKAVPVENIARAEEQMENTEEKEEEDDALPVHVLPEIGLVVDEQALRNIAPIWNLLLDAISA